MGRALDSLATQTLRDWELLLVNNGSTDGTTHLAAARAENDRRIRLLNMDDADLVGALNWGLAATRGPLVARMDADDEMHPDRLAEQVEALEINPTWGLVGSGVDFGGDASAQAGYAAHVAWLNGQISPLQIRLARFVESPFAHPSVMWRREVSESHGGYRAGDFPEDYELWLRWLDAGVVMGKVPRSLLIWHDSPGRLSRADSRYRPEAFYALKARFIATELARTGNGREVWIAGSGRPTRQRAGGLERHGVVPVGYADVAPRKIGQSINGRPVVSPGQLPAPDRVVVLAYVGNRGARKKLRALFTQQGRVEGKDFWLCA